MTRLILPKRSEIMNYDEGYTLFMPADDHGIKLDFMDSQNAFSNVLAFSCNLSLERHF